MGFLTSLFGGEGLTIWSVGLALIIVLVMIVIAVWLLKILFNATSHVGKNKNKRLAVIDTVPVDSKRNLVLIRRDDVEHLVLVGGGQDFAVETGIPTQYAPSPVSKSSNQPPKSAEAKSSEAANRLGLNGLLKRYNGPEQQAPKANATAPQQKPRIIVTPTGAKSNSAPTSANVAPAAAAATQQPENASPNEGKMSPLDRLKALGMRSDEEPPKPLKHKGLLVADSEESVNPQDQEQNPAAQSTDSANVANDLNDLDAANSVEKGQKVANGNAAEPSGAKAD